MLRVERKYLVPYQNMDALRERLSSFVRSDRYALKNCDGIEQYTVRSIYYDSRNLECYSDKHEGVMMRRKLRIRGYENGESEQVVLEIKRKIASRQKKYRSLVRFGDVEKLMETGNLEKYIILNGSGSFDNASRFMYHIKKGNYTPTCLITYEREAYHGKFDDGVRITFDKNIRSRLYPEIDTLYSENNLRFLFKRHFILEIKYFSQNMPLWLRSVVQEFRLRNDALSKYAIGIDVNRERVVATY